VDLGQQGLCDMQLGKISPMELMHQPMRRWVRHKEGNINFEELYVIYFHLYAR